MNVVPDHHARERSGHAGARARDSPMGDAETEATVTAALGVGYRLIDTAENYRNEEGVGRGIRASGVDRDEIFVTTKFNERWHGVDEAQQAFANSAERLGLDRIDLLLIHWPNPKRDRYVDAWRGLIRLLEDGKVRAIGVSNFKPAHLDRLLEETGVAPHVNQVQLDPRIGRADRAELPHGARHRDGELVADRRGRRPARRRDDRRRGASARQDAGPGRAPLACSARAIPIPRPRGRSGSPRTSTSSTSSSVRRRWTGSPASIARGAGAIDSDRFGH